MDAPAANPGAAEIGRPDPKPFRSGGFLLAAVGAGAPSRISVELGDKLPPMLLADAPDASA